MERIIKKYRIASARLKEYDYSTPNWYFVTINTKDHHEYFGEIKNG
ncbi:MAG: transposase, partial [Ignavibacteria bacterium]|nr:transposase [Ignavibacteria bacterium]